MDPNHIRREATVIQSQQVSSVGIGPPESSTSGASHRPLAILFSNTTSSQPRYLFFFGSSGIQHKLRTRHLHRFGGSFLSHQAHPITTAPTAHTQVQLEQSHYGSLHPAGLSSQAQSDSHLHRGMPSNTIHDQSPVRGSFTTSQHPDWLAQPLSNVDGHGLSNEQDLNSGFLLRPNAPLPWHSDISSASPNLTFAYPQPSLHHSTCSPEDTDTSSDMQPFSAPLQLSDSAMHASFGLAHTYLTIPLDDVQPLSLQHLGVNMEPRLSRLASPLITSEPESASNREPAVTSELGGLSAKAVTSDYKKERDLDVRNIEKKARQGVAKGFDDVQMALDSLPFPYEPAAKKTRRTRKAILKDAAQALS